MVCFDQQHTSLCSACMTAVSCTETCVSRILFTAAPRLESSSLTLAGLAWGLCPQTIWRMRLLS